MGDLNNNCTRKNVNVKGEAMGVRTGQIRDECVEEPQGHVVPNVGILTSKQEIRLVSK